jgi:FkbM family methyltransferase
MGELELSVLRAMGRCVPPVPHASGLINRLLKPLYLRKRRASVVADAWGFRLRLDPKEAIDGAILFCPQLYNRSEFRWLRETLRPTDTFVDVGAHIGSYSLYASRYARRVIAVEPNPATFSRLLENIGLNGAQIDARNIGASDKRETLRLHLQGETNAGGCSFVIEHGKGDVEVPCLPLGDICPQIDILKLDVEMMEYRVLSPYLAVHRPRAIIMEKHAAPNAVALCLERGYRIADTTRENALFMRT